MTDHDQNCGAPDIQFLSRMRSMRFHCAMTKIVELFPDQEQKMEDMRRSCDWQGHSSGVSL